jgi:hypothetical protein
MNFSNQWVTTNFIFFTRIYLVLLTIILFGQTTIFSATKTWNGGTGTGLSWTTAGNWLPTGAPASGDDIIFNTAGTITFSTMTGNVSYNSLSILQGTVTLAHTGGTTLTLGGNSGDDLVIAADASLTLGTNVNITLAANATADISGTLTISSGRTYHTNNNPVVTTVTGSIINSGIVNCNTASRLLFQSGSTYQHSLNGGNIPIATWNANSTCWVTSIVGTLPGGTTQNFGHLTWNCPLQTQNGQLDEVITTQGNLTIISTGTGAVTTKNDRANLVGGDYFQSGGIFNLGNNNAHSLTVSGNFSLSGGSFIKTGDNSPGGVLNVAGNFSITGGTLAGGNLLNVYFNGTGIQVFQSGGTVTGTTNFTVNSGATLQMDAEGTVVSGTDFTLLNGATLGIRSASGISSSGATGNIQVTGTRTFNTGANYIYNGSSAQSTGTGVPTNLTGVLTINNNGNTVTLDNARTIANLGSINLTAGTFATGTNLTMATTSSINRSEGNLTGTLQGSGIYNVTYTGNSKTTGGELSGSGLNNVTLNLSSDQTLTFDQSRTVPGTLTMTNGDINTESNTLSLGTSTSSLGVLSRTSGTIIGNFRRWFAASAVSNVLFPVGTADNYRPANISFTSAPSAGGTLTAFFTGTDPGTAGLPQDDGGISIINAGKEGYWTINAGDGLTSGVYSLDLTADGFSGVSDYTTLRIIKRPIGGGNWILQGTHVAGTGSNSTPIVHRTGMSGFSEFGIGGASDNALPVELSSFSAILLDGSVKLVWRTETEVSNYGFEIERLQDYNIEKLQDWTKLGFVQGHGNSNSPKDYSFTDDLTLTPALTRTLYYRLKQIDTDGQFEYSKVIEIDLGSPAKFELSQNYPNPFNPTTKIEYQLPFESNVNIELYNITGERVDVLVNQEQAAGYYTVEVNSTKYSLSSGVYIYRMTAVSTKDLKSYTQLKKMVLLK